MKKVELLSLSVVTAALIMTGCSDDDSSKGASAPSEATTPIEINSTTAQNVAALLRNAGGGPMAPAKSEQLASIKTRVAALKASGSDSGTDTYDCDISGTWTSAYSSTWTESPDGSWNSTYTGTDSYKNCVDNYSGTNDVGDDLNMRVQNGTYKWSNTGEYNSDTNRSKDSWSATNNMVDSRENNETSASRVYTSSDSYSATEEADGEYIYASNVTRSYSYNVNGEYKRVDTNTSGDVVYGYRYEYGNMTQTQEEIMDYDLMEYVQSTISANGFYSDYDTNSTGEYLADSAYFKNFVMSWSSDGANEGNMTVSGTVGESCLGGSVTLATAPVIQENQVDYFDGSDATGSNVLPYAGTLSMTGSATATLSFDADDTNHTTATVSIGDNNDTYTGWNTLAVGACSSF